MKRQNKVPTALIFGGSGFIGNHLSIKLRKEGYKVVVADLKAPKDKTFEYYVTDVRNSINLPINYTPDLVFNLAAVHRTPGHRVEEYYETNISGAINIVNWCARVSAKTLIFTSSISVYGADSSIKNEDSLLAPTHAYGISKMLSENIFQNWQLDNSIDRKLLICRPAVIFGPGENGNFTRLAKGLKRRSFFYPSGSGTIKACGYVDDLVEALIFCITKVKSQHIIFNFCYPQKYSIKDICENFKKVANYPLPFHIQVGEVAKILVHLPKPISHLGSRIKKLTEDTNIEPMVLQQLGFKWSTDLEMGLRDWQVKSLTPGFFA